jgi:hypothetical protein
MLKKPPLISHAGNWWLYLTAEVDNLPSGKQKEFLLHTNHEYKLERKADVVTVWRYL